MANQEAELIFIPFPIIGHLLVTIELAKLLISHDPRRIHTITILHWSLPFLPRSETDAFLHSLIEAESRIRLVALPDLQNPPPMELFVKASEAYILEFVKKMVPLVKEALSTLLSSSSSRDALGSVRVAGIVLDFFCVPLIDVGSEFNLPSYIFLTCSAGFLGMMKYLPERHRRIKSKFERSSGEESNPIPGFVKSVPTKVLPPGLFTKESYEAWVEIADRFSEAKGILVNSFTSLECNAFDYFDRRPDFYPTVYPMGPILCSNDRLNLNSSEQDRIMRWLDDQPESSVVFLCFGSMKKLAASQIHIARALEFVGCRFLWSIRTDPKEYPNPNDILPAGFMNRVSGQGLVCGWAPQVKILSHKATGGFLSHCGWNSTLESLRFGVPIATWPMYAEQQLNAFTMVKELGLAVEMRLDYVWANGDVVKADEIAKALRSLMEAEDVPRRKLKEIAEAAKKTVMDDGSSFVAVEKFIDDLMKLAMD